MLRLLWVVAAVLLISPCQSQIFPFSNLKHFLNHKSKSVTAGSKPASTASSDPPALAESESVLKARTVPAPAPSSTRTPFLPTPAPIPGEGGGGGSSTQSFLDYFPHFDLDEGFREFRMPDPQPNPSRVIETHSFPAYILDERPGGGGGGGGGGGDKRRPSHHQKAYDYSTPNSVSTNDEVLYSPTRRLVEPDLPALNSSGSVLAEDELSYFLTPPRVPRPRPNNSTTDPDFLPSASSKSGIKILPNTDSKTLPPVPSIYLKAPPLKNHASNHNNHHKSPRPVANGHLDLSDVAEAAVSHSNNPSILKGSTNFPKKDGASLSKPVANKTPANHNPYPSIVRSPPVKKPLGSLSNHKMEKVNKNHTDKPTKISIWDPDRENLTDKSVTNNSVPVDSSPTETATYKHRTHHHNHKYGPKQTTSASNHAQHRHKYRKDDTTDRRRKPSLPMPNHALEQEVAASGLHTGFPGGPPPADGDRIEFQMHGMQGPKSYKFGYDTGKGHNRQFRYEERDPDGYVKGHYGYVDKEGKLQVVNYKADPHHGFSADVSKLHL